MIPKPILESLLLGKVKLELKRFLSCDRGCTASAPATSTPGASSNPRRLQVTRLWGALHSQEVAFQLALPFSGVAFPACGLGGSLLDFGLGNGRGAVPLLVAFMSGGFAIGAAGVFGN